MRGRHSPGPARTAASGAIALAASILAIGCYSASGRSSGDDADAADTGWDTGTDTWADTGWDTGVDPGMDTGTDTWPDGPPACEPRAPAPDGAWLYFSIVPGDWEEDDLVEDCYVSSVTEPEPGRTTIVLSCVLSPPDMMIDRTVEVTTSPETWIPLWEGQDVVLSRVARWGGEWIDRWFRISWPDGGIIVAGVQATSIAPPDRDPGEWYSPVDVSVISDLCPVLDDECGPMERLALYVNLSGSRDLVFDGNYASIGMMMTVEALVGVAHRYHDMECMDMPYERFDALIMVPPGM